MRSFINTNCNSEGNSSLPCPPADPHDAEDNLLKQIALLNLEIEKNQQSFLDYNKELKATQLLLIAAQKRLDDSEKVLEEQEDERSNLLTKYKNSRRSGLVKDQTMARGGTVKATSSASERLTTAVKENCPPGSAAKVTGFPGKGFYVAIPPVGRFDGPAKKRVKHEEPNEGLPSPSSPMGIRSNSVRGQFKPRRYYGGKMASKFMGTRTSIAIKKEVQEKE